MQDNPRSIRVAGRDFAITYDYSSDEKYGLIKYDEHQILADENQNPIELRDTILHEVLHAIDHYWSIDLVEKQVHSMANALMQVVLDNPQFFVWLSQQGGKGRNGAISKRKKDTR